MSNIPLFPLAAVLFPYGRMPLQIFEPRYLDLVSRCLKEDSGFGVVWLQRGDEVFRAGQNAPAMAELGCYAKIVDWTSLPNGLLGITIEGGDIFRLLGSNSRADHLSMGDIEWLEPEPEIALPEHSDELMALLQQLVSHPHVERLGIDAAVSHVGQLSCLLAQLLPIDEASKYKLLTISQPLSRLEKLTEILDNMSQGTSA